MANKNSSSSKIVGALLLIPVVIGLVYVSTFFLPLWRWVNIDFKAMEAKTHVKQAELEKKYDFKVRYHPRAPKDPVPFQLFELSPNWNENPDHPDEDHLLVRVVFISDLTGTGPDEGYIGDNDKGRYFKGTCWRLPKGSIPGVNKFHPVILYEGASTPMTNAEVGFWAYQINNTSGWRNDDDDIDDGFKVPTPDQPQ
jgi:hypothetical protein